MPVICSKNRNFINIGLFENLIGGSNIEPEKPGQQPTLVGIF